MTYIYLYIKSNEARPSSYKFGCTSNPLNRLKQEGTGFSTPNKYIALYLINMTSTYLNRKLYKHPDKLISYFIKNNSFSNYCDELKYNFPYLHKINTSIICGKGGTEHIKPYGFKYFDKLIQTDFSVLGIDTIHKYSNYDMDLINTYVYNKKILIGIPPCVAHINKIIVHINNCKNKIIDNKFDVNYNDNSLIQTEVQFKGYLCIRCGEKFTSYDNFNNHLIIPNICTTKYVCIPAEFLAKNYELCIKQFMSVYIELINNKHNKYYKITYICDDCYGIFNYKATLHKHKKNGCTNKNIIKNDVPNIIKNDVPNIIKNDVPNIVKNDVPNIVMSQYICLRCGKDYKQFGSFTNHLKKRCKTKYFAINNKKQLDNYDLYHMKLYSSLILMKSASDTAIKFVCERCFNVYENRSYHSRHYNYHCDKLNKNKHNKNATNTQNSITDNIVNANTKTNNSNVSSNNSSNIIINNYTKEIKLSDELKKKHLYIIEHKPDEVISEIFKSIHIDIPENRNVYVKDIKDGYAMVMLNNKWKAVQMDEIMNDMILESANIVGNTIKDNREILSSVAEKIKDIISKVENADVNHVRLLKNKIKYVACNNRDLVRTTYEDSIGKKVKLNMKPYTGKGYGYNLSI